MDYTKLPRELIYKERKDLEEFADGEETNFIIIDNMLSNLFFDGPDGKERALKCLNTAYYICTLILLCKKRPEWDFNYYCEIANCTYDNHKDLINQGFTLSLVYLYLTHTYYDAQCPKLLNILKDYIDSHSLDFSLYDIYPFSYALKTISKGLSNDFHIAEEFNPRRIRRDIFREIESHRGCIWNKLTDNYREEETKKLIEAIGKDEEEKHIIIELINSDAERFYGIDNFYFKENVKPMLDEMDRQICSENIEASKKDTDTQNPTINNDQTQDDNQKIIEKQEKRIKELEKEVNELKGQAERANELEKELNELKELLESNAKKTKLHDKVRLELVLRFMEEAGCNLEKYGNKANSARILNTITDIPFSTCSNYVTNRNLNTNTHKEEVVTINSALQALEINFIL